MIHDQVGDSYGKPMKDAEACGAICRSTVGCKAFTYNPAEQTKPNCHLKTKRLGQMADYIQIDSIMQVGDACYGMDLGRMRRVFEP